MTGQVKSLKLCCIAAIFLGIATAVFGIVLAVGDMVDFDAWITALSGATASITGAKSAILANVPSNAGKVRTMCAVAFFACAGALFFVYRAGAAALVAQLILCAVLTLVVALACVMASRVLKAEMYK